MLRFHAIMHAINEINPIIGVLLLLLVWGVWRLRPILVAILRELECLHQDYDLVTEAHERAASKVDQEV